MKRLLALFLALCCLMSVATAEVGDSYNWYEVFVRSYQDSDGDGIGDLSGLRQRLDYIADMGWNGIWLMPIMPSPSYHKYDVLDYMAVDEEYGTLDDMRALVEECHARGIRIIIDLPVNHTALRHPWFLAAAEALQKRQESPYTDYYCFTEKGGGKTVQLSGTSWFYEEQFSGGGMPDLNLDSPAVLEEIRAIMAFWLQDVGVDGFRLDAVTSFFAGNVDKNVAFLDQMKAMAEELKPGSYLVGEAWVGQSALAQYAESKVDSFFLFPSAQVDSFVVKSLMGRSPDANKYANGLQNVLEAMPETTVLAPFLCNHDTGRTIGLLQARKLPARAKMAHGLLGMLPGNVFTYYGDEIGMVGAATDPDKRLAMYWNDGDMTEQPPGVTTIEYAYPCVDEQLADPASLTNYIKALNHVRLAEPAIARGKNETIFVDKALCLMSRTLDGETIYIAANVSKTEQIFDLPEEGLAIAHDLEAAGGAATIADGMCTLPGMGIVILK